jgi:hypothetical protein
LPNKNGKINFIIPVKNRENNFKYVIDNIINNSTKYDIIITIFEYGNLFEEICKSKNINYISFNEKYLNNIFNKSISINLIYKLYELKNIKYTGIIFHDADCAIQTNFFDNLYEIIEKYDCIQTYGNRYVFMANEILSNKIRNFEININIVHIIKNNIQIPKAGSTGGSIYITKKIFEDVGGFDPELFSGYNCEDMFFWNKVSFLTEIGYCDNPLNNIIHLYHESERNNVVEIEQTNKYYITNNYLPQLFNLLTNEHKYKILKEFEQKLI